MSIASMGHPAISSSDALFSFCLQSFPASGTFPVSWLLASDDQHTGASASASVLPTLLLKTPTFTNTAYPLLYGIARFSGDPADGLMAALAGIQLKIPLLSWRVILQIALFLLVYVLVFGIFNVAISYYMREMLRGNPVFLFSDFKYAVKKNFKQGFGMGLIDVAILGILVFDFANMPSNSLMYFLILGVAIIYFIMRFYLYLMLITFDMKISKMFKNAFLFVILGVKRNVMAILWIFVMLALNFAIFALYMPLGIALPILYFFSFSTFTTAYAAYPVIQKYMIDPYENKKEPEPPENEGE